MGNICRSPTAEGIFRAIANKNATLKNLEIDSCGTIGYHEGEPSDPRSVKAAQARGYDLTKIRARKLNQQDLRYFDHVLVMDKENYTNTVSAAKGEIDLVAKVKLFLEYSNNYDEREVPDPYYGGAKGFDYVIDLIEDASLGLIKVLASNTK